LYFRNGVLVERRFWVEVRMDVVGISERLKRMI